jgi:hypothetical protein
MDASLDQAKALVSVVMRSIYCRFIVPVMSTPVFGESGGIALSSFKRHCVQRSSRRTFSPVMAVKLEFDLASTGLDIRWSISTRL